MATSGDNLSTEWVIMSDLMQCMLCYTPVRDPRTLSACRHTFCFDCILQWWQQSAESDMTSVSCPTCRVSTTLPTEGISALSSDIKENRIGDMLRQCVVVVNKEMAGTGGCSAASTGTGVTSPPCDVCSLDAGGNIKTHSVAIRFCEDCRNHLCTSCSEKHASAAVFARHRVLELGEGGKASDILCSKHPGKSLQYLCNTCPSVVCSVCVTTQHGQGHDVKEIVNIVESNRGEIKKLLTCIDRMSEGIDSKDALIEEMVMKTKEVFWAVAKQIGDHADACRKEIEESENALLRFVEEKKSNSVKTIRDVGSRRRYKISDMEHLRAYGEKLVTSAAPLEFISNYEDLIIRLKTVLECQDKDWTLKIDGVGARFIVQQGLLSLGRLEDCMLDLEEKARRPRRRSRGPSSSKSRASKDLSQRKDHPVPQAPKVTLDMSDSNQGKRDEGDAKGGCVTTEKGVITGKQGPPEGATQKLDVSQPSGPGSHEEPTAATATEQRSETTENMKMNPITEEASVVQEKRQGPKLLWESRTSDIAEGEVSKPRDVCFLKSEEVVVLNDTCHDLVCFSPDGKERRVISNHFSSPMCVAGIEDGRAAVTDSQEECIKLISADGGTYHVWALDGIMASGFVIRRDGKWMVLDKINDSFGIFGEPGTVCEKKVQLSKHLLYTERYLACDSKGRLFVSGIEDTAVAVFDPDGHHLMDIGSSGSKGGYVSVPRGLYVDEHDNLVVADRHNHRVTLFSPDGLFIKHIVTCPFEKVIWPTGIDLHKTASGSLQMAVTGGDTVVQVYEFPNGAY